MQRISSSSRKYPILFQSWLVSGSPIDLTTSFDWKERRFRVLDTGIQVRRQFQNGWMELTALRCPRLGPPCLAKRLSCARSMSSLPVRSGGKGVAGHSALRSNSRRVRGVSHCRDKLSQNQLGVLCRCCFSSFRRLAMGGGEESVVGSASTYSCRFRLRGIGVFSKGNES